MVKYGNLDGFIFEYFIQKNIDNGFSLEEVYQLIIDSSSCMDQCFNVDCQ